jgi:hypothetical protein
MAARSRIPAFEFLWVAKTSSAHEIVNLQRLAPSGYPLFFVLGPSPTPREQQLARHRHGNVLKPLLFRAQVLDGEFSDSVFLRRKLPS